MKKTISRQQAEAMLAIAKDNVATLERSSFSNLNGPIYRNEVALVAKLEKLLAR